MEQEQGVTQGNEAPQHVAQDSAPESIVQGDAQNDNSGAQGDQPKSKEFNFKQMRENVSRLENERKQWLAEKEHLQSAAELERYLRKDPKEGLKHVAKTFGVDLKTLIEAQSQSELPQIDFQQYEPETGKLLKFLHDRAAKVEALEQWKEQFEQKIEEGQKQASESQRSQNMSSLDEKFESALVKDGFMDPEGNGDQDLIEIVRGAVLAKLAQQGDPRLATPQMFQEAYLKVSKGLTAHKNKTLQNTVTKSLPPTGSKQGQATTAKPAMSRDQRIAQIAEASKAMFGME